MTHSLEMFVLFELDHANFYVNMVTHTIYKDGNILGVEPFGEFKQFVAILVDYTFEPCVYVYKIKIVEIPLGGVKELHLEQIVILNVFKIKSSLDFYSEFKHLRPMIPVSMAVTETPRGTCVAVHCSEFENLARCLKLYFFGKRKKLFRTLVLDMAPYKIEQICRLNFGGIFGDLLILNGFTETTKPECFTFACNLKTMRFDLDSELEKPRLNCGKIYRFIQVKKNKFIGVSMNGIIVSFRYGFDDYNEDEDLMIDGGAANDVTEAE